MSEERYNEIWNEVVLRTGLWLENSTFEKMTVGQSMMRFEMAIGLDGYPFAKESWMTNDQFNKFLNEGEFDDPNYDFIITNIFHQLQKLTK